MTKAASQLQTDGSLVWRHLAITLELVLPSAHPSPQPKSQSQFCTAHSRVSLGMTWHVISDNNCPFERDLGPIYNVSTKKTPHPLSIMV